MPGAAATPLSTSRVPKRLYEKRDLLLDQIKARYLKTGTVSKVLTSRKIAKRASGAGMNKTLDRDR